MRSDFALNSSEGLGVLLFFFKQSIEFTNKRKLIIKAKPEIIFKV